MNISTLPTRLAKDRQSVCGQAERVSPPKREIVRFSLGVWVNTYATVTFREVLSTTYHPIFLFVYIGYTRIERFDGRERPSFLFILEFFRKNNFYCLGEVL